MSRNGAELLYRVLCPYVDELVKAALTGRVTIEEATFESLAELICFEVEVKVRRMVKALNRKMRAGELEDLRRLVRENPEAARKAAKYVARRLKHRVRHVIEEALSQSHLHRNTHRSKRCNHSWNSAGRQIHTSNEKRRTHQKGSRD